MFPLMALLAQSVMTVPDVVHCAADQRVAPPAAAPDSLSLVIATSGIQDDPRPAPCDPDGTGGDFHFRSTFSKAQTLAGAVLEPNFEAGLKLRSPYISRYRLALIIERLNDGSLLVRRAAGFNGRNGIACFDRSDEWPVDWRPEAKAVRWQGRTLCVFDPAEIDPNAPKG